ncbi:MAG: zinc ribbon domain-containing protein [Planctomycetales bacterium]|nr:zinc ribbon domain-containing protein [Planctomycetales bacterium]NIM09236.1 zinc ribbon domain-containing protein [Planctomycetales bacterium]NIN08641.1 zinc ribbon domain-containing protein [Planctomycetales bacterium]NIN77767.1 zinc ribbon domain-containing protein [Planctomycetales bacterium]NIO34943.1 zinc ribbon domain-containing protein [Planctomycetales bacterium]
MPIYEYICGKCQSKFEVLVRGTEQVRCEQCGSDRLEKLLSVPAAHTPGGSSKLPICEPPPGIPGGGPCGRGGCGLPECG